MNEDEANVAVKVEKEEENDAAKWTDIIIVVQKWRRQNETQN